jgi:hypothetical protein
MDMSGRGRPKGAWETYPPLDPEAEMTWAQINAKVDELLADPGARRHKFSGSPDVERVTETVEILPHGARRIRVHWPE